MPVQEALLEQGRAQGLKLEQILVLEQVPGLGEQQRGQQGLLALVPTAEKRAAAVLEPLGPEPLGPAAAGPEVVRWAGSLQPGWRQRRSRESRRNHGR